MRQRLVGMAVAAVLMGLAGGLASAQTWGVAQTDGHFSNRPAVASDTREGRFLAVWQDAPTGSDMNIHGRGSREGNGFAGPSFVISDAPGDQLLPDVAYDPVHRQYLVVWSDHRASGSVSQVWGQIVSASGTLVGANFAIANNGLLDYRQPAVAFDYAAEQYLVVWVEYSSAGGTYRAIDGAFVRWDGVLAGAPAQKLSVAQTLVEMPQSHDRQISLAVDSIHGEVLVAWRELDDNQATWSRIAYRRVLRGGALADATAGNASAGTSLASLPRVSYDSLTERYLVIWEDGGTVSVRGQFVNRSGQLVGTMFSVTEPGGAFEGKPAVAWDPADGRHVAAWLRYSTAPGLETRRIHSNGTMSDVTVVDSDPCLCCNPDVAPNRFHPSDGIVFGRSRVLTEDPYWIPFVLIGEEEPPIRLADGTLVRHDVWQAYASLSPTFALGVGNGGEGRSEFFRRGADGRFQNERFSQVLWSVYNQTKGEVRLASGDLDGDGVDEVVIGFDSFPSKGGRIAVYRCSPNGLVLVRWLVFPFSLYNASNGETWVACGDLDGDGRDEIVVGGGAGAGGMFCVWNNAIEGFAALGSGLVPWPVYDALRGECRPACGDTDGDGADEVLIGLGPGGRGLVAKFTGPRGRQFRAWLRFPDPGYDTTVGSVRPGVGDVDGDGRAEVLLGTDAYTANPGRIAVLDDAVQGHVFLRYLRVPYPAYNAGPAAGENHPAVGQLDDDRAFEVLAGLADGGGGYVVRWDDAIQQFGTARFERLQLPSYNAAYGKTWPTIGLFVTR